MSKILAHRVKHTAEQGSILSFRRSCELAGVPNIVVQKLILGNAN